MIPICCIAFACTNPENHVDDKDDTAGLNYKTDDELNTSNGGMSDDNAGSGAGLDTSYMPKDTPNPMQRQQR